MESLFLRRQRGLAAVIRLLWVHGVGGHCANQDNQQQMIYPILLDARDARIVCKRLFLSSKCDVSCSRNCSRLRCLVIVCVFGVDPLLWKQCLAFSKFYQLMVRLDSQYKGESKKFVTNSFFPEVVTISLGIVYFFLNKSETSLQLNRFSNVHFYLVISSNIVFFFLFCDRHILSKSADHLKICTHYFHK